LKKSFIFLLWLSFIVTFLGGCQVSEAEKDTLESLKVEKAQVRVYFTPELNSPIQYNQYKDRTPDPKKHRIVEYIVTVRNDGRKEKHFVIYEPIVDPEFQGLVINSTGSIPVNIPAGRRVNLLNVCYLTEGDPQKIEKLAYQSQVKIVWEEDGRKWEKTVPVAQAR